MRSTSPKVEVRTVAPLMAMVALVSFRSPVEAVMSFETVMALSTFTVRSKKVWAELAKVSAPAEVWLAWEKKFESFVP